MFFLQRKTEQSELCSDVAPRVGLRTNGPLFVIVAASIYIMLTAPLLTGLSPRCFRHWRRSALPPAEPQDRYESNTEEKTRDT